MQALLLLFLKSAIKILLLFIINLNLNLIFIIFKIIQVTMNRNFIYLLSLQLLRSLLYASHKFSKFNYYKIICFTLAIKVLQHFFNNFSKNSQLTSTISLYSSSCILTISVSICSNLTKLFSTRSIKHSGNPV